MGIPLAKNLKKLLLCDCYSMTIYEAFKGTGKSYAANSSKSGSILIVIFHKLLI